MIKVILLVEQLISSYVFVNTLFYVISETGVQVKCTKVNLSGIKISQFSKDFMFFQTNWPNNNSILFPVFLEAYIEEKMANISIRPTKKRRVSINAEKCCFCLKGFSGEDPYTELDSKNPEALLSACKERQDDTANYVLANELKIRSGELLVRYHKSGRSKYMHPFYRNYDETKAEEAESSGAVSQQFTRSRALNQSFNWKENCFICGKKCNPKQRSTWSKVEGAIDKNSNCYTKVMRAAKIYED